MNKKIHKYWILVASKNHVLRGINEGIAQACHGRAQPLKRTSIGDGIIYYSAKLEFEKNIPYQEFTAIGLVSGEEVYAYDMGNGFRPYRRNIRYIEEMNETWCDIAHETTIKGVLTYPAESFVH
jgi:hypothetical protein